MLPFFLSLSLSLNFLCSVNLFFRFVFSWSGCCCGCYNSMRQWAMLIVQADAFNEVIQYRSTVWNPHKLISIKQKKMNLGSWRGRRRRQWMVPTSWRKNILSIMGKWMIAYVTVTKLFKSSYILIGSTFYVRSIWLQPGTS